MRIMRRALPFRLFSLLLALATPVALPVASAQPGGAPSIEFAARGRHISRSDLGTGGTTVSQSSVGFAVDVPFGIAGA
jgi:hypothetical protein